MTVSHKAEEVMEALWAKIMEGGQEGVSLEVVGLDASSPILKELLEEGLVRKVDADMLVLSGAGKVEAEKMIRRHRLAERLLVDVLETRSLQMEEAACQFEHALHEGIDENICTLLGHPKACPHGMPIPEGPCCKRAEKTSRKLVSCLADLAPGQKGKIAYLHVRQSQELQKLTSLGVLPGMEISLISRFPSYVFQVGLSQFAVDREMAEEIYVRLT